MLISASPMPPEAYTTYLATAQEDSPCDVSELDPPDNPLTPAFCEALGRTQGLGESPKIGRIPRSLFRIPPLHRIRQGPRVREITAPHMQQEARSDGHRLSRLQPPRPRDERGNAGSVAEPEQVVAPRRHEEWISGDHGISNCVFAPRRSHDPHAGVHRRRREMRAIRLRMLDQRR